MTVVAAAALAADRRLVNALRERGANSAATAVSIDTASGFERRRLAGLERRGYVHRLDNDTFYIDEEAWGEHEARTARVRNIMLVVVLVFGAVLWFFVQSRR